MSSNDFFTLEIAKLNENPPEVKSVLLDCGKTVSVVALLGLTLSTMGPTDRLPAEGNSSALTRAGGSLSGVAI